MVIRRRSVVVPSDFYFRFDLHVVVDITTDISTRMVHSMIALTGLKRFSSKTFDPEVITLDRKIAFFYENINEFSYVISNMKVMKKQQFSEYLLATSYIC